MKERAEAVLEELEITVSDAARIFTTRTATEGVLPFTPTANSTGYDAWFRAKVRKHWMTAPCNCR